MGQEMSFSFLFPSSEGLWSYNFLHSNLHLPSPETQSDRQPRGSEGRGGLVLATGEHLRDNVRV